MRKPSVSPRAPQPPNGAVLRGRPAGRPWAPKPHACRSIPAPLTRSEQNVFDERDVPHNGGIRGGSGCAPGRNRQNRIGREGERATGTSRPSWRTMAAHRAATKSSLRDIFGTAAFTRGAAEELIERFRNEREQPQATCGTSWCPMPPICARRLARSLRAWPQRGRRWRAAKRSVRRTAAEGSAPARRKSAGQRRHADRRHRPGPPTRRPNLGTASAQHVAPAAGGAGSRKRHGCAAQAGQTGDRKTAKARSLLSMDRVRRAAGRAAPLTSALLGKTVRGLTFRVNASRATRKTSPTADRGM